MIPGSFISDPRWFCWKSRRILPKSRRKFIKSEVHPKSWTKNWGAHYEVQKTWY